MSRRSTSEERMPTPVESAQAGTEAWQTAAGRQLGARGRHEDFYDLGAQITQTLSALDDVASVLARQVENYGTGREIYDDSRDTPYQVNPYMRLGTAVEHLQALRGDLAEANQTANDYWSAISHIGVEHYDTAESDQARNQGADQFGD